MPALRALLFALTGLLAACAPEAPPRRPAVLVHVMPWFESKDRSGAWGWHWTMDKRNPDRGELAAHDRPLIGPYDSSDPAVVAYQVALMKAAGVDGVILDWYGPGGFKDYEAIHRASLLLVAEVKKAGLKFAVCVEDNAGARFMKEAGLSRAAATSKVAESFEWLEKHWLRDPDYFRLEGRPLLLIFGPQYLTEPEWTAIRTRMPSSPLVFTLPHLAFRAGGSWGVDGAYAWIPVSEGRTIAPEAWKAEFAALHQGPDKDRMLAAAFPGYRDFYAEAGLHASYGRIDHRDGATFAESLDLALNSGAKVVQIATWNDYGEDTGIEPTAKRGHRELETLMRRLRPGADTAELSRITEAYLKACGR